MQAYKVERSNVIYNKDERSMVCTFTITHIKTQEKYIFKNVFLAEENKEAFLVFPSTNEKVYINKEQVKELLSYRIIHINPFKKIQK